MPKNAALSNPLWIGVGAILAITLWRVGLLAFATADLFVDEAQYWAWGQHLEFGYYSKPPLIGWVIRAFTELGGSDSPFWIRLPGPLFHAATALIVLAIARHLWGGAAGAAAGITYATMPAVTLASFLISTDTILMPFFALAIAIYLRLTGRASPLWAIALGASLGVGMMAKYAAIYFLLGASLGALFIHQARISWRDAALAGITFLIVVAPNILWNLQNGLTTIAHTADNVDWVTDPSTRLRLNFAGLAEFFAGQFAVIGPVFFAAYLIILIQAARKGTGWVRRWLICMSLPIILLICVQAILSRAYANWAAPAYVAAVLLTAPWLWERARGWFWAGLGFNGLLAIVLPVTTLFAESWMINDRLVLGRYVDRAATSQRILTLADTHDIPHVVSDSRDLLADLFHAAKGTDIAVHSVPFPHHTPHYYAQRFPFPQSSGENALLVVFADAPPTCRNAPAQLLAQWTSGPGAYRNKRLSAYLVAPDCWSTPGQ